MTNEAEKRTQAPEAETVDWQEQGKLDEGDTTEPKHEQTGLVPLVPTGE